MEEYSTLYFQYIQYSSSILSLVKVIHHVDNIPRDFVSTIHFEILCSNRSHDEKIETRYFMFSVSSVFLLGYRNSMQFFMILCWHWALCCFQIGLMMQMEEFDTLCCQYLIEYFGIFLLNL